MRFEILWYSGGPDYAPNRCIGRTIVSRKDLDAAITAACNIMKSNKGDAKMARGFYVREER